MQKRSFLLRTVTKNDAAVFRALYLKKQIDAGNKQLSLADIAELRFSEAHGRMLEQIQKRNTILFDLLTRIRGKAYTLSAQPLDDMLEDCVMADLQRPVDKSMSLTLLTADGSFHSILGDGSKVKVIDRAGTEKIVTIEKLDDELTRLFYSGFRIGDKYYKPFIASASMSRVGQYFFVAADIRRALINQTSLGLIDENDQHELTMIDLPAGLKAGKVIPNKIAAYMGLTLSDGQSVKEMQVRFEACHPDAMKPDVHLDQSNSICVADMNVSAGFELLGPFCWKAGQTMAADKSFSMARLTSSSNLGAAKLYDGCGFFSPELMDELERLMLCKNCLDEKKERRYDSLVIRLPWMKGLAVRMDYLGFIRELLEQKVGKFVDELKEKMADTAEKTADARQKAEQTYCGMLESGFYSVDEDQRWTLSDKGLCAVRIKDVYGIFRPLWSMKEEKAVPAVRALFTQSMFKGFGHFQSAHCEFKYATNADGWLEYWQRLREVDASLLIATQNSKPGKYASINYQLLASSGMSDATVNSLLKGTVSVARALLNADVHAVGDVSDGDEAVVEGEALEVENPFEQQEPPPDDDPGKDGNDNSGNDLDVTIQGIDLAEACRKNPDVRDLPFIRSELTTLAKAQMINAARGRLRVRGDYRFLVPDLIAMLTMIVNKQVHLPENIQSSSEGEPTMRPGPIGANEAFESAINDRSIDEGHGYYYAPGIKAKEIALYRNPHVCAGENVLLKRIPTHRLAQYETWCRKLGGLVFIPAPAAATLSGSDSDGDRGLVSDDPVLIRSVKDVADAEARLIRAAVRNREKLIQLADRLALSDAQQPYLKALLEQLPEALPEGQAWGKHYSAGVIFDPVNTGDGKIELSKLILEEKLYDTWNLTRHQRVGNMSLFGLDISRHVYSNKALEEVRQVTAKLEAGASDDETLLCLLERFLALWRCVDTSLAIANEIDSAKTGVVPKICPLNLFERDDSGKGSDEQQRLFGKDVTEQCAFRHFRTQLKIARSEVNRFARNAKIRDQVQKASHNCPSKTDDAITLSLNALPARVSECWKQLEAEYIAETEKIEKKYKAEAETLPKQMEGYLLDNEKLKALPDWLTVKESDFQKDLAAAERLLAAYREESQHRSAARKRRDKLLERFYNINRCLLRRYALEDAQKKLKELMGDGSPEENALAKQLGNSGNPRLRRMCEQLKKQSNLLRLLWAEEEGRKAQLKTLCNLDLDDSPLLTELFCTDMDGVYLLKHVLHYLMEATDMTQTGEPFVLTVEGSPNRGMVNGLRTPEELQRNFERIAAWRLKKKRYALRLAKKRYALQLVKKRDALRQAKKQYALRLAVEALSAKREDWLLFAILDEDYVKYIKRKEEGQ